MPTWRRPDIESGTAPVEGTASGVVVIDGDLLFMGEGPLREPVILHIAEGQVVGIEGAERGPADPDDPALRR